MEILTTTTATAKKLTAKEKKKLNTENIILNEGFSQVCVWEGTIVGEKEIPGFVNHMKQTFCIDIQYLEEIIIGDRNDLLFAVKDTDIKNFSVSRLAYNISWVEDSIQYNQSIWPERIKLYCHW